MFNAFKSCIKNPSWRSITFAIVMGAMIALTIHDSYLLFLRYLSDPKESDMRIEVNETMPVPDITFCVPSTHAKSHFKEASLNVPISELQKFMNKYKTKEEFLSKKMGEKVLSSAFDAVATLHTLEREMFGSFLAKRLKTFGTSSAKYFTKRRENVKFWIDNTEKLNVTFDDFKQKVGSEMINIMVRGEFQRLYHNRTDSTREALDTETTWISEKDFCFKANLTEKTGEAVGNQKPFMFLNFFQNDGALKKDESIKCASMNFHGDPYDISAFTEHGASSRDGITESICPGLRYDVTVEVVDVYQMVENDEEGTMCQELGDDDGNEEKTEFECHSICRAKLIKDICNCTASTTKHLVDEEGDLPSCGDYSQCAVDVQHYTSQEDDCTEKCKRDCKQVRFQIVSGQTARIIHPLSNGTKVKSNAMTTVFISWASFEYMTVEQSEVYSYSSFVGELGGILGLWLGLSVLGIVKESFTTVEDVTTKTARAVHSMRKKSHGKNEENTTKERPSLRQRNV